MIKAKFLPIVFVVFGAVLLSLGIGSGQFDYSKNIYASADTNEYTITFDTSDWAGHDIKITNTAGTEVSEATPINYTYTTGEASQRIYLYNLSITGYDFAGWWVGPLERVKQDTNQESQYYGFYYIESSTNSNITLYANFDAIQYTITYKNVDGVNNPNQVYYTTDQGLVLKNAQKTGYNFLGWYMDAEFTHQITEITQGAIGEVVLYAKFEVQKCTITYTYGGYESITLDYGTEITSDMLPTPTREGYVFEGWYTSAGYIQNVLPGDTISSSCNLYAKWSKIENPIWKPLTFGSMGLVIVLAIIWCVAFGKHRRDVE